MVVDFQNACLRTRYARVPVVAAPFGLALGGGAEVVLGCQVVRAAAELYVGCVEVGVGLIPAGGGCMEMAARAVGARHRRSAVRHPVAGARAVPDARDARACRPAPRTRATSATCAQGDSVSMARETADRRRQGSSRSAWPAPATARPRRAASASSARRGAATLRAALHNLLGRAPDHRARRQDRRPPGARPVGRRGPGGRGRQRAAHPRPRARGVPVAVRGTEDPRPHPTHAAEEQASAELRSTTMRDVAILSAVRTADRARAARRASRTPAPTIWRALAITEALRRAEVEPATIEDVVLGCAHPEAEQGLNVARQVGFLAGLPDSVPAMTINRFCSSGLQAAVDRRRSHRGRRHRRGAGRRPGVDVADPDGRRQDRAQPGGRRAVPRRVHPDGQHRRERRAPVRRQPRRSGRVRARQPPEGGGGAGRAATSRPRSCRSRRACSTARSGATSPSTRTRARAPTRRWRSWRR